MSADILSKLKTLHEEVRARIEATPDFKAMKAVERAIGELDAILAVPVAANSDAIESEAMSEVVETPAIEEAASEAPMAPEAAPEVAAAAEEAAEPTVEEVVEAAVA